MDSKKGCKFTSTNKQNTKIMKIQVTKIEAGQTIKVGRIYTTEQSIEYYTEQIADGWDFAADTLKEYEEKLAKGIEGAIITEGKHTIELKVLDVKEYVDYSSYNLNGRSVGFNEKLIITDKGTFTAPNRNKVTLV